MTFPRNMGQIPIYYNHKSTGRPYAGNFLDKYKSRYLDVPNDPLYPFGYGLSYTHFNYSDITIARKQYRPGEPIEVKVTVTNSGSFDGEETVQLYVQDVMASVTQPVEELKKFQKVFLRKGESREVSFLLNINDLKFYNTDLKLIYEPGDFNVYIGSNSRDVLKASFTLTR